ncbi:hypothetical protein P8452_47139 [Trifolium repens]|nr:hypothetical protein P8452_47139 [Trifolium repens]
MSGKNDPKKVKKSKLKNFIQATGNYIMPGRRERPEVFRESATTSSTSILPPNQPTPSQPTILPVHQPTPSYRPTFPARHSVSSFPSSSHHSIPPTETFSTQVAPSYGISPELFHDSSGNFLALLGTFNQPHQQQHQQSTPQEQEQQSTPQEQGRAARKQRRPRVTEDKIVAVGKRSVIYPIGRGLEPNKEASKGITTALRAIYQDAFFPTYHHLKKNKDAKKKIIAEFELCCAWKPEHDDEVIKIFHHLASSRLSGMLYEARQEYETRDGDFKPEWIGEEVWPQLLEYWQKDETFARRSSANKKNRDSKKGGYKHTQGSASVDTHRRALERQLGRKPFINEVHDATHKIWGTDEYIDTRSAVTQKKYDESVQSYLREHPEYSSNADLSEPTQLQMWDEISGPGNTDFRRYGYGNLAPNFEYGSMSYIPTGEEQYRSATVPPEMQQTIDTMTQQLQSQNQELQRRAQREKELEERLTKESEDRLRWQKQMEERFLYAYNSQPPPHHGSASRFDPSENESDNERDDFDEE